MEIKNHFPPNIDEIRKHFAIPNNAVFTYGNTLYNPYEVIISDELEKHEETHAKQQGDDPKKWWARYFEDKAFRLAQEVEAYQVQYKAARKTMKNREILFRYLHSMATDLSSKMYGNIITYQEAIKEIKDNYRMSYKPNYPYKKKEVDNSKEEKRYREEVLPYIPKEKKRKK